MMKLLNQLLAIAAKYRFIVIGAVVLVLIGYTLWRIQIISNPQPDKAYLESKNRNPPVTKIQIKDSVRTQIEQLQDTPVNVQPGQLGTPDPFNP